MITLDDFFDDENKELRNKLEAQSAGILNGINKPDTQFSDLQNLNSERLIKRQQEMMANKPFGENSIFYKPVPKLVNHSIKEA